MTQLIELQRALQSHVVDSDASVASAIESTENVSAETRLKIYSDAYRLRLIDGLRANYPALAKFLGESEFGRLAQLYIAIYPSRHYSIRWFGHRLAEFLCDSPDYSDRPWLTELAEWEWKIANAFDSADAEALRVENLATIPPEAWAELRFDFHSSLQVMTTRTNCVAIARGSADEQALPNGALLALSTQWLIWRKELTPQYRSLAPPEATALKAAIRGQTFGEICELVANETGIEDAPLQAASFLKQWVLDGCLIGLRVD